MRSTVEKYILKHKLQNATVLVAYSGGADSVALLHACADLPIKLAAIHLNHGWRGVESDSDEQCARDFCQKLGVEFYSEKLLPDVKHTETAAREARYAFFDKCISIFNADALFLAHNKNDNVETLIYRLIKGTGIDGLCAIPRSRGKFHRPVLDISRETIENYVRENSLPVAVDASNKDIKYARNFIREEILPKILELNPDAFDAMENLIKIASGQQGIIKEITSGVMKSENSLDTQKFLALPAALQMSVLHNFLKNDLKNCAYWKFEELLGVIHKNSKYPSAKKTSLNANLFLMVNRSEIAKISVL